MPDSLWFTNKDCTSLEIIKYQSAAKREVASVVKICDPEVTQKLMARIENIPPDGEMMISLSPSAEAIDLRFHCESGSVQTVEIYQHRFKTPSTGFNAGKDANEAALYADIEALLYPQIGKQLLMVKDLELKFDTCSITYTGDIKSHAPVTVSPVRRTFVVKDQTGREQTLASVVSQTTPKPVDFEINGVGMTLLTFQTKSGERLYPDYFQVVRE